MRGSINTLMKRCVASESFRINLLLLSCGEMGNRFIFLRSFHEEMSRFKVSHKKEMSFCSRGEFFVVFSWSLALRKKRISVFFFLRVSFHKDMIRFRVSLIEAVYFFMGGRSIHIFFGNIFWFFCDSFMRRWVT